jgi:hypothetical protein
MTEAAGGFLTIYDIGSNNTYNTNNFNGTVVWYVDGGTNNANNTVNFEDGNVTMIY